MKELREKIDRARSLCYVVLKNNYEMRDNTSIMGVFYDSALDNAKGLIRDLNEIIKLQQQQLAKERRKEHADSEGTVEQSVG